MTASSTFFNMEEIERLQASYNAGGLEAVIPDIKSKLDDLDNAQLNIAVMGDGGSGKSTLITGMIDPEISEEERAVDKETNKEPVGYLHPVLPKVQFWELPGIDLPKLQLNDDLKMANIGQYDIFIIVSDRRFKGSAGEAAKAILQECKALYLVQTKVDSLIGTAEEMESTAFDDELQRLRTDCASSLEAAGSAAAPSIFLVSAFHPDKFDFPALKLALASHLQKVNKATFLLSLPGVTSRIMEQKRNMLEKRIWMTATLAGAVGAVPVPGLSFVTCIGLLAAGLLYLWHQRDLHNKCLQKLATTGGKSLPALQTALKPPGKIPRALVRTLLCVSAVACAVAEVKLSFTPLTISVFGAVSSFCFTAMLLKDSLSERVKTTQRLVKTAFDTH